MKDYKNALKLIIGGAIIFAFGILIGSSLDFGSLASIEGYLYNGVTATPGDATSGNATSGNATSGNATSGNATSGNATSGDIPSTTPSTTPNTKAVIPSTQPTSEATRIANAKTIEADNDSNVKTFVDEIKTSSDGSVLVLKVNANTIVTRDVFEAIKGTDKTLRIINNGNELVFNGKDIINPKDINASVKIDNISDHSELSKDVSSGILVRFADNGNLPGKATVRIFNDPLVENILGEKINVYYYDKDNNEYVSIANNVVLSSNYYSFNITHHSDYILTNDEIKNTKEDTTVDGKTSVSFQKSNTVQYILIAFGVIAIIASAASLYILNKKKKNTDNKVESEPTKEEFPWDTKK